MVADEREPIKIYPWSISVTGGFSKEELLHLEMFPIDMLVEDFNSSPYAIARGLAELLDHGAVRRAVELARGLVTLNPVHEERLKEFTGESSMDFWLRKPLEEIPSQPSEIAGPIEYVQ